MSDLSAQKEQLKEEYGEGIEEVQTWQVYYRWYQDHLEDFIIERVKIEDKDHPDSVVIPFNLWEGQKKALSKIEDNRRVIILKARQLGLSWLAISYIVHELLFNPGHTASTISQTEGDSKELIRRIGFILKHLPNWLIVSEKATKDDLDENKTGITYTQHSLQIIMNFPGEQEESRVIGRTSSPGSARSFTDNIVLLDEWAHHPNAREIWRAAYPVINRPTGGKVIGISTGEKGTLFQEKWEVANWKYGAEKGGGKNNFAGIFLPWDADPRRDQKWLEETKQEMGNGFKSEYPSLPSEAFTTGSGAFFTEFNRDVHIPYGRDWYPPSTWKIIGAYDGGYNRAAFKWYAISNDGWVICYREYYPAKKIDPVQAEDIKELSRDPDGAPEQLSYIIADTSCWAKSQDTGKTTIEIMEEHQIRPWRQADKERIMGWKRLHEFLLPIRDEQNNIVKDRFGQPLAKLRYTEACSNTIRIFPSLKNNDNKPDDLASGQEDHLHDCDRYMVMSRPRAPVSDYEKQKRKHERSKQIKPRSSVVGY